MITQNSHKPWLGLLGLTVLLPGCVHTADSTPAAKPEKRLQIVLSSQFYQ